MKRSTKLILIGIVSVVVGLVVVQTIDSVMAAYLDHARSDDAIAWFPVSTLGSLLQYGLAPFGGCLVALGVADLIPRNAPSAAEMSTGQDQSADQDQEPTPPRR
jgi:uncharacterized protein YjeT (DUF2065 family)